MTRDLISTIDDILGELFDEYERGPEANRGVIRAAIPLMLRARMAAHAGEHAIADRLRNETASLIEQHIPRQQCGT